jgi:hypothetical protein
MQYCANEYCIENAMKNSKFCQVHSGYARINFDAAHLAWMRNKTKIKSSYVYVCGSFKRHGGFCKKRIANHLDKIHCIGHQKNITMIFY